MDKYTKCANTAWRILAVIVAILFAAMLFIVFWQIICRYVLRLSNGWTQEVSTLIFVWITFLGAALAIRSGSQIAMKVLLQKIKASIRHYAEVITAVICEVFYVFLTIAGFSAIRIFYDVKTPALGMTMAIPYFSIGLAGACMVFLGLDEIFKPVKQIRCIRKGELI